MTIIVNKYCEKNINEPIIFVLKIIKRNEGKKIKNNILNSILVELEISILCLNKKVTLIYKTITASKIYNISNNGILYAVIKLIEHNTNNTLSILF